MRLNENQHRNLSATLRVLEESINEIQAMAKRRHERHTLYDIKNSLSPDQKAVIERNSRAVKRILRRLHEKFDLDRDVVDAKSAINASLSSLWVMMSDSGTKRLRGYGELSEGLSDYLDPQIKEIVDLIDEMKGKISNSTPRAGE